MAIRGFTICEPYIFWRFADLRFGDPIVFETKKIFSCPPLLEVKTLQYNIPSTPASCHLSFLFFHMCILFPLKSVREEGGGGELSPPSSCGYNGYLEGFPLLAPGDDWIHSCKSILAGWIRVPATLTYTVNTLNKEKDAWRMTSVLWQLTSANCQNRAFSTLSSLS